MDTGLKSYPVVDGLVQITKSSLVLRLTVCSVCVFGVNFCCITVAVNYCCPPNADIIKKAYCLIRPVFFFYSINNDRKRRRAFTI